MTRIERLTERAITFPIAEANETLAVARLAFLAPDDHAALDAAIDACLARRDRSLRTRWRAISFLVRVRYEDQPTPDQPAAAGVGGASGGKGRAPGNSRGPRRDDQPG
jgi:predicted RNA polymerase sigma factor